MAAGLLAEALEAAAFVGLRAEVFFITGCGRKLSLGFFLTFEDVVLGTSFFEDDLVDACFVDVVVDAFFVVDGFEDFAVGLDVFEGVDLDVFAFDCGVAVFSDLAEPRFDVGCFFIVLDVLDALGVVVVGFWTSSSSMTCSVVIVLKIGRAHV